jgi:hypothetical protein
VAPYDRHVDEHEEYVDLDDLEDLDELPEDWERPPCLVAGCSRPGIIILFRGVGDDDPHMTMGRVCEVHLVKLFDLSDGQLRPRPGVELDAIAPRPPSASTAMN